MLALWALVAGVLACEARTPASVPPDPESTAPEQMEPAAQAGVTLRAYELRYEGQLIGSSDLRQTILPDGSRELESRMSFTLIRDVGGQEDRFHSESRSSARYDGSSRLLEDESIDLEAGVETRERSHFEEEAGRRVLVVEYEGAGYADTRRYPLPSDFYDSLEVFERLKDEFAATGQPVSERFSTFSSSRRAFEPETMTIEAHGDFVHGGESHEGWTVRSVDASESETLAIVDDQFVPYHVRIDGGFEISWVDDAPDESAIDGARISSVIAVDGPVIGDWHALKTLSLQVTIEGDDPDRKPVFESGIYHQVRRGQEHYALKLQSTRLPVNHRAPTLPLHSLDAGVSRFLAATPQSQSDHPEIVKQASAIVGSKANSLQATERIVAWVHHGLAKEAGARGSATATETLRQRKGDCTEHAVLVVALARAGGIPARQVDGIVFLPGADGRLMAGYHAWAEVWVGRWMAVDATVGEVGSSARYIAFGYNEPGEPETATALVRTLGKTRIVVTGHSLFSGG
jgi:hypothetical protein